MSDGGTVSPFPINRGVPVFANANQGPGTDSVERINDADPSTVWGSYGANLSTTPATVAFDLSSVPLARRRNVMVLLHFSEASWSYDYRPGGVSAEAEAWTIEVHAGAGGQAAPASGWVSKGTVSGNTLRSRQSAVDLSDGDWKWLRVRMTAGAAGSSFVKLNLDVFDATTPGSDAWLMLGDSITAYYMRQGASGATGGTVAGLRSISQYVNEGVASGAATFAASGHFPPVHGGGFGGWTTADYLDATKLDFAGQTPIDAFIARFPGRYVCVGLGTNDIGQGLPLATTMANFRTIANKIVAAGKVPCFPRMPWAPRGDVQSQAPMINTQLDALITSIPGAVRGPDFYALFQANPGFLGDGLHPNDDGIRMMRQAWAKTIAATIPAGP